MDVFVRGPLAFDIPLPASINLPALILTLAAMIAMFRFKIGMIATLTISCALGFIPYLLQGTEPGNLYGGLLGFVAGIVIGFPAGPVAVWCLHLRIQGRRAMAFAIIVGSAIGDVIVAAGFFIVTDLFGNFLVSLQVLKDPIVQGPALIVSGIVLLFIVVDCCNGFRSSDVR